MKNFNFYQNLRNLFSHINNLLSVAKKAFLSNSTDKIPFAERLNKYAALKHKSKIMTLVYATLLVVAFVLSIANHNNVNASVAPQNNMDYLLLENSMSDNLDENNIYPEESLENIRSLFEMVNYKETTKVIEHEIKLSKGDTFINILTNLGMEYKDAYGVYLELKKVYAPENLKAGQIINITTTVNTELNQLISLDNILIEPKPGQRFIVERDENNNFLARKEKDDLILEVKSADGIIDGTLSNSMHKAGVPNKIIANFINIFSYSIDFRRDVKKGDKFEIIYENHLTPNGELVQTSNILFAALTLKKDRIALHRFKDSSGQVDYYDEKGFAMKKTLHRKPLAFQSARISSPFGKRRHPIKKKIIVHWGVDYAAPKGTAIYAAGDGVVQAAKWNGGYGNYIKIRHNSEYSTAYAHMWKFAKGIRPGKRVKQGQVIGYVGSTGLSTGPHLHYEVVKNGRRVNPLRIKAAAGENLAGKNLRKFKAQVADLKKTYHSLFAKYEKKNDKLAKK